MAWLGLGVFYTGVIVGIPTVTGVAEGVSHQKKVNEEAANETRMVKFYLDAFCDANSFLKSEVHGCMVVLKHGKAWKSQQTSVQKWLTSQIGVAVTERPKYPTSDAFAKLPSTSPLYWILYHVPRWRPKSRREGVGYDDIRRSTHAELDLCR